MLPSKSNKRDAQALLMTYINTHTPFTDPYEIIQKYKAIAYQCDDMGENVKSITYYENIL
jgi:hypothetical protein